MALKIPECIWSQNAGAPYAVLDIAPAIGRSPKSSALDFDLSAAHRYGLTDGSSRSSKTIGLLPRGRNLVAPTAETDTPGEIRAALLESAPLAWFYRRFDGKLVPEKGVLQNTLMRPESEGGLGLSKSAAASLVNVAIGNAKDYGLLQEVNGSQYLRLDYLSNGAGIINGVRLTSPAPGPASTPGTSPIVDLSSTLTSDEACAPSVGTPARKQIFVAHGKNRKPLEQLEKILKEYDLPYLVAIDEPHVGRPIGNKVSELMKECTSGIFVCSADELVIDNEGNEAWRPSDNVVYELGAASVLYGDKIIIFRESDVSFGSDFSALGHITFEKDRLDAMGLALLKELKGLGFLKFTLT